MTIVTIKQNAVTEKPVVHKIGNWYKTKDNEYVLLANVQARAVLVYPDGDFHDRPIDYQSRSAITQREFDKCCGQMVGEFHLVSKITISEE